MINHIRKATVLIPSTVTYDEYNEKIEGKPSSRTITIAISLRTGSTQIINSVKSINSDYIGVTSDKEIKENQQIVCGDWIYNIDYIDVLGRKTILYLTRVKQYGN